MQDKITLEWFAKGPDAWKKYQDKKRDWKAFRKKVRAEEKDKAFVERVYRAAKLTDMLIQRGEGRITSHNRGGYLLHADYGEIIAGENFDSSLTKVYNMCRELWENHWRRCRSDCKACTEGRSKAEIKRRRQEEIFVRFKSS